VTFSANADKAIGYIAQRLDVWIDALRTELDEAQSRFELGDDRAAASFLKILRAVLEEHASAFGRYKAASTAPAGDRFRWFGIIGLGLAGLVYHLALLIQKGSRPSVFTGMCTRRSHRSRSVTQGASG
jgi:hypothetical protein